MPTRIAPGTKLGLKLTAAERKLLLDLTCLEEVYAQALRDTPVDQPLELSQDDWDDFGGYVAAEANHTKDKKVEWKLDTIFNKVQNIFDEKPPKTVKIDEATRAKAIADETVKTDEATRAKAIADEAVKIAELAVVMLIAAIRLGIKHKPLEHFSLSPAQRDVLLAVPRIPNEIKSKLGKKGESFTVAEVCQMTVALAGELPKSPAQKQVVLLLVVMHLVERLNAVVGPAEAKANKDKMPKATSLYQFKITLKEIEPPIWRRIQVRDCTLDKLHEHIQTAMGWTNSHLHQFTISGVRYGDPELLDEGWEDETPAVNSLQTKVRKIVPKNGRRFAFDYEYDFGDGWKHEILFEGCLRAKKGTRYPLCVEGERACPPEDVGGPHGYQEYLVALANPRHKRHKEFMDWSGPFDPEQFDAQIATKEMRKELPDWREMELHFRQEGP